MIVENARFGLPTRFDRLKLLSDVDTGTFHLASLDPALTSIRDVIDALQARSGEVVETLRPTVTRQANDAVLAPCSPVSPPTIHGRRSRR